MKVKIKLYYKDVEMVFYPASKKLKITKDQEPKKELTTEEEIEKLKNNLFDFIENNEKA